MINRKSLNVAVCVPFLLALACERAPNCPTPSKLRNFSPPKSTTKRKLSAAESMRNYFDVSSPDVVRALNEHFSSPDILAIVPRNKTEFAHTYDKPGTAAELASLNKTTDAWSALDQTTVLESKHVQGTFAAHTEALVRNNVGSGRGIVVFAHNSEGKLRFPDGTKMPISRLHAYQTRSEPILVLSCKTAEFPEAVGKGVLVKPELDFLQTAKAIKRVQGKDKGVKTTTFREYLESLAWELEHEANVPQRRVQIAAAIVGGVLLVTIYAVPPANSGDDDE